MYSFVIWISCIEIQNKLQALDCNQESVFIGEQYSMQMRCDHCILQKASLVAPCQYIKSVPFSSS